MTPLVISPLEGHRFLHHLLASSLKHKAKYHSRNQSPSRPASFQHHYLGSSQNNPLASSFRLFQRSIGSRTLYLFSPEPIALHSFCHGTRPRIMLSSFFRCCIFCLTYYLCIFCFFVHIPHGIICIVKHTIKIMLS